MPLYQVWDVPSSTLIVETRVWGQIQEVIEALVNDNGYDVLDDVKVLECRWQQTPRVFSKSEVIRNILGR